MSEAQPVVEVIVDTPAGNTSSFQEYLRRENSNGERSDLPRPQVKEKNVAEAVPQPVQEVIPPVVDVVKGQDGADGKKESDGVIPQDSESVAAKQAESRANTVNKTNQIVQERLKKQKVQLEKRYSVEVGRMREEIRSLKASAVSGDAVEVKPAEPVTAESKVDEVPKGGEPRPEDFGSLGEYFDAHDAWLAGDESVVEPVTEPVAPAVVDPVVESKVDEPVAAPERSIEDSPVGDIDESVKVQWARSAHDAIMLSDEVPDDVWGKMADLQNGGEVVVTDYLMGHVGNEDVDSDERARFFLAMVENPAEALKASKLLTANGQIKAIQKLVAKPKLKASGNADLAPNQAPVRGASSVPKPASVKGQSYNEYMVQQAENVKKPTNPYAPSYAA